MFIKGYWWKAEVETMHNMCAMSSFYAIDIHKFLIIHLPFLNIKINLCFIVASISLDFIHGIVNTWNYTVSNIYTSHLSLLVN